MTIDQREEEEDGEFCVKTNRACYGPRKLVGFLFVILCCFILYLDQKRIDNSLIYSVKQPGKLVGDTSISSSLFLDTGYQMLHLLLSSLQGVKCWGSRESASHLRHAIRLISQ